MGSVLVAFGVIFLAELGDKSQLMTLAFAARHRAATVLTGLLLAVGTLNLVAVTVGTVVAERVPTTTLSLVAGLAFLGFAAWTLLGDDDEDGEDPGRDASRPDGGDAVPTEGAVATPQAEPIATAESVGRSRPAVVAVAGAFFLAELGDKTQLATVTLAAQRSPVAVWVGSTAAIVAVNVLAIVAGRLLHRRLPADVLRYGSAALFVLFGAALIIDGLTG